LATPPTGTLSGGPTGTVGGSPLRAGLSAPGSRIGNDEYHSALLPAAQEAAVLYAANLADAAEAVLRAETRNPATRDNRQPWLMLFDLYEINRNREAFDALAALFRAKFDQPAPAWPEGAASLEDPRRVHGRERHDFFALAPDAMGDLAPAIEKLLALAEAAGTVRIDFGPIVAITTEEAALLTGALQRLRRAGTPMWFNHADALERVLRVALNERASEATRSFWLLLFEVILLQGKREAYEALGLEYAVAFETAPPGWQVYVNAISAAAARAAPAAPSSPPEGGVALRGVISAASQAEFAEIAERAAQHGETVIDMGKVMRIDFGVCAAFFEVVKAIQLGGRRVILANLSELNAALLEAFGFNRHAILMRRKAG
jgi:anti-anti-sigma regulatory factor